MFESPVRLRYDDANVRATVRDAVRFCLGVAVVGVVFVVTAAVWISTCSGATADTVACGVPQRTVLAVGAPAILLLGALRAFVRAYVTWRRNETWWAWQAAGWLLFTSMLLVTAISMPGLAGPGMFGG